MHNNVMHKPGKKPVVWKNISVLIFDCDGVLTDGKIIYSGEMLESKNFSAHDGLGFSLLNTAKITSVVITGRTSKTLQRRCDDLKIKHLFQGVRNKEEQVQSLLDQLGLSWANVLYMGDDWNDVPAMKKAAISIAPADAVLDIQTIADYTTEHNGGDGAARECIDIVLKNKGIYEKTIAAFLQELTS